MGDNAAATGKPVAFRVQLSNPTPGAIYTVSVVKDGSAFGTFQTTETSATAEFTDTPSSDGRTYYRVTVEGPSVPYPEAPDAQQRSGNMIGLSNPIYFNFDPAF
ncbi:MAG: hypothetical protein EOP61_38060 [Sphingomonadales bacterium]|nr:MAG: hypothetical protein EOP61_38060 [Sphingomonadales bacterium]